MGLVLIRTVIFPWFKVFTAHVSLMILKNKNWVQKFEFILDFVFTQGKHVHRGSDVYIRLH